MKWLRKWCWLETDDASVMGLSTYEAAHWLTDMTLDEMFEVVLVQTDDGSIVG